MPVAKDDWNGVAIWSGAVAECGDGVGAAVSCACSTAGCTGTVQQDAARRDDGRSGDEAFEGGHRFHAEYGDASLPGGGDDGSGRVASHDAEVIELGKKISVSQTDICSTG
jgi:hypothetical protein